TGDLVEGNIFQGGGTGSSIDVESAGDTIGGTVAGAGNLIDGGGGSIVSHGCSGLVVERNLIRTNAQGTAATNCAFFLSGTTNCTIGGTTAAARNVISEKGGLTITNSSEIVIEGNYIGTNAAGTAGINTPGNGINLESGVSDCTIGGTAIG